MLFRVKLTTLIACSVLASVVGVVVDVVVGLPLVPSQHTGSHKVPQVSSTNTVLTCT